MSELLERSSQLDALGGAFEAVGGGSRGRLELIGGEAGAGKTSLLRRFCDGRRGATGRVLWGSCDALFTPGPLGPLHDVAEQTQGHLKDVVDGAGGPWDVATALLQELTARTPTILVLEDLHWADEATLDVVRLLARRIDTVPALVLASYRDDELDRVHPLRLVLGEIATSSGVSRLSVPLLSADAVAELAAPHGFDAGELYRTTGGNPFFVTEVLAAGRDEIPPTVRDAVLARVARLDPRARTVVEIVAVAPREMEAWLVDALAGDAADRLEECLAAGILVPRPGAVAFRHELARIAVQESLPPNLRVSLHAKALATLATRGKGTPDAARLADHAEEAGDEHAVLQFAPQAAVAAASVGAHREAAAQYARALRFDRGLALEERAGLLGRRAQECALIGEFTEAARVLEAALECHRRLGDARAEGDSLRELSRLLWSLGRTSDAEAAADLAVSVLEREPPDLALILAYCTRSELYRYANDNEAGLELGNRALALARELGESDGELHALTAIGATEYLMDSDGKREELERIVARAREARLEVPVAIAYCTLAYGAFMSRRHADAIAYVEAGNEHCAQHDLDGWGPYLLAVRAEVELQQGLWNEAVDTAALALAVAAGEDRSTGHGLGPGSTLALTVLGRVRARRGDPDVWSPLDEALGLAAPTRQNLRMRPVAVARAEAAWLEGREELMPDALSDAFAIATRQSDPWTVGELAFWRWRAGIDDEIPSGTSQPYASQMAGDWQRAADLWAELGCPYESAMALADADDDDALRRSLALLQELGARPAAAMVSRRLRERGARGVPRGPRPRTRQNEANLTPRQVEVLALLSEGLRNAEIAERLFLSEKTVDHHVSAILGKLEVQSRGQAAAEAARLGIA